MPSLIGIKVDETKRPVGSRTGRYLTVTIRWKEVDRYRLSEVRLEFVRGFASSAEYGCGQGYQRVWRDMTTDEPLAFHRPLYLPDATWTAVGTRAFIAADTWGADVYRRLKGYEADSTAQGKSFDAAANSLAANDFHPEVVASEGGLNTSQKVARAAVATAMTAIAREFVGLDPLK